LNVDDKRYVARCRSPRIAVHVELRQRSERPPLVADRDLVEKCALCLRHRA
jgi:hypothetical protein